MVKIKFNKKQLEKLADYTANISLIFVGTVIAQFFNGLDKINLSVVVFGLIDGIISLVISLYLLKKKKIIYDKY